MEREEKRKADEIKDQQRQLALKQSEEMLKMKCEETMAKREELNRRSEKALEIHRERALERAFKHRLEIIDRLEHVER